jgi:Protein of unknown function (DUF2501)
MTFMFTLKLRVCGIAAFAAIAMLQFSAPPVRAQLPGGLGGNALGGLSGGLPSVTQAGPANTAGVLQYCVQNNYLSDGVAEPAKNTLLGQVPGAGQSSGFKAGSSGLLETGNGQSFNLGGGDSGGIKSQVTHNVCDMVLQHAKSLL